MIFRCSSNNFTRVMTAVAVLLGFGPFAAAGEDYEAAGLQQATVLQAEQLRDTAAEGSQAWEWVESLTTEVGPRLAGTAAEQRARDWALAKLQTLGFEQVRVEPFSIQGWERGEEYAQVLTPFPQPLVVTALGGSVATPNDGIAGDVVVFKNLAALEAAAPGSLAGKIVYVGHAMRATQDGSHYGYFGRLRREGASIAASKGAAGLLIRSIGTDSHRMPHTGSMKYAPDIPRIPAAAVSNPDADQLERMAARGVPLSIAMTLTPRFTGEVPSANIIVDIPGTEWPDQYVVIGGHLDSWDLGTGAVDDGAGIGITLEAARMILTSGLKPRRTIRLIFWGAEEVGLLGGYAYAERHAQTLRNHVAGSESDFGAGKIWKVTSRVSPEAEPLVDVIASVVEPLGIARGETDASGAGPDLYPMVKLGMPSIRFVQDGSDYFDLHHTPDDTLDKINPRDLDQSVAAYVAFVWLAANSSLADWGWSNDGLE